MHLDIERIGAIVREVAAAEVLPRWRNLARHEIMSKTHADDLVTVADKAAEVALVARLEDALAGSVAIGEESVSERPELIAELSGERPVWVIDPIDGTKAFTEGEPEFDVMVALVHRHERIAGWIYAPVDDDLYLGERGAGAGRDQRGRRSSLPRAPSGRAFAEQSGMLGWKAMRSMRRRQDRGEAPRFPSLGGLGCCGHDYARLLRGEAQFVLYGRSRPWDHLPGLALLEEQGFLALQLDGALYDGREPERGLMTAPDRETWDRLAHLLLPL
jgi:fructose-1,6-bisphosphatase/inositol monophosphatase family enzyme